MKLNKTLALAALVAGSLLAGAATVQAQDSSTNPVPGTNAPVAHPGMRPRGMINIERLARVLSLTDEQKTNVQAAITDMQTQMTELRGDSSLTPEDKRAKSRELREALNAKFKDILTPEQYARWQQIMPGHRRQPPTPPANNPTSTNAPTTGT